MTGNSTLNVFSGSKSIREYLNPENSYPTPLVELPEALNPFRGKGVRIFAKLMNTLPLGNMKSLPAYNMLTNNDLNGIDTIIENSSGNTAFSLAVIARALGVPRTKAVVSNEISMGKLKLLRLLGTEIIVNEEPICPNPSDTTSGIYKAKKWAREMGWFNPGQYENEYNPEAHYKWTGPQIWEQTEGKVSLVCVGLGTTGSVTGIGRYLKERNEKIKIIGVHRSVNNAVPGVRTKTLLKQVSFNWRTQVDSLEEVGSTESYKKSLDLCRSGLFVGPSSGFALAGLLEHISKLDLSSGEEICAVFICPDSPFPYIDEYFEYLKEDNFPKIENYDLLKKSPLTTRHSENSIRELGPLEIYNIVFKDTPQVMWQNIKVGNPVDKNNGYELIDLRSRDEFDEYHIPQSVNIPTQYIRQAIEQGNLTKDKSVVFICKHGNTSALTCREADVLGIRSINLIGGITEWSRLNLPRILASGCYGLEN